MSLTAEARTIIIGGQRLRVVTRPGQATAGSRPPLLLINGIGVSLEMLDPLVRDLDPDVDVIRFDPPGIGGPAQPPGPYRFTRLCRLITRMLTEPGGRSGTPPRSPRPRPGPWSPRSTPAS